PWPRLAMTPAISLLLDLTRFALALVVAGTHLTLAAFQDRLPDLRSFALIAVGGFFLLSGYTIRYITQRTRDAAGVRRYLVERAARLLSVSLPALAFTAACDACAVAVAPAWYASYFGQNADRPWLRLAINAVLFSQPYGHDISPLSNDPFWSLS